MNTPHRSRPARPACRLASACLLALAAGVAFPTQADDWEQAQEAFAELDDRAALGHLRSAAAAGDARAERALALALRHGERLFPGLAQTDLAAAGRWPQALGLSLLLPASAVPAKKHTRAALYVNALQAWTMKEAAPSEVVFLDIRSRAEAAYVGMPTVVDALVPFREHDDQMTEWDNERRTFSLRLNPGFAQEVAQVLQAKGLGKNVPLVLICRSGDRSAKAADLLLAQGYGRVHTVVDGFEGDLDVQGRREVNGWKNAGLPWTYRLEKAKVLSASN
jgi:rhodanese-related sulfurtransferase